MTDISMVMTAVMVAVNSTGPDTEYKYPCELASVDGDASSH